MEVAQRCLDNGGPTVFRFSHCLLYIPKTVFGTGLVVRDICMRNCIPNGSIAIYSYCSPVT